MKTINALALAALLLLSQIGDNSWAQAPRLANISTRMQVLTGENVMIGGFIIEGAASKTVVVRARGPSLAAAGVPGVLANPVLQLYSGQSQIASNDDYATAPNLTDLVASGFAPLDPLESAILITLAPGAYTAIVSGAGGLTGVGIVEVFEVDNPGVPLVNIATRGQVLTGDDVMIGGFIIQGSGPQTVAVRARGPSLAAAGVANPLANPSMRLYSGQSMIVANDNYSTMPNAIDLVANGFAPSNPLESAILITLNPGAYSAVVTGGEGGAATGVGLLEVFAVPPGADLQPMVLGTSPANTAMQVSVLDPVSVTFSEPMDPATLNTSTFTLTGPFGLVDGSVSFSGNTATFTPAAGYLLTEAVYTGAVSTGARDLSGKPMASHQVFSFTTRDTEPPPAVAGCPAPEAGSEVRRLDHPGAPRIFKRKSGHVTSYRLPRPGSIRFLQGQVASTPASPYTELTISRCPGVIEQNLHAKCRLASPFYQFNEIAAVDRPLTDNQDTAAGCLAPSDDQYYVNVRWTFPFCPYGDGQCGFSIQWAN